MSGRVHECDLQLRTRDINWAGHLDNVETVRILEEARALFLGHYLPGQPGFHHGILNTIDPDQMVTHLVAGQSVEYRQEIPFSLQPLRVRQWVGRVGRTSFTMQAEVHSGAALVAISEATVALREVVTGSGWPISDALREALEGYLGDPVPLRPRA